MTPSTQPSAMRISLPRGQFAIVDAEDYPLLSRHTWFLDETPSNMYAYTYFPTTYGNKCITMHHVVLGTTMKIDHFNNNGLDCRKENLRPCTSQENSWNKSKNRTYKGKLPTSRFKGVCRPTGSRKWLVAIRKDGKRHHLGFFDSEDDAGRAYNEAARRLFGKFAWLNPV